MHLGNAEAESIIPERATDERRSKEITPSGFGYSIFSHSLAGFIFEWSAPPWDNVHLSKFKPNVPSNSN